VRRRWRSVEPTNDKNPEDSTAQVRPQKCLDVVRGTHLGQRSSGPHKQAGDMTAFEPSLFFRTAFLELSGPSTHRVLGCHRQFCDAGIAFQASRPALRLGVYNLMI
jgi:hypothetical protein